MRKLFLLLIAVTLIMSCKKDEAIKITSASNTSFAAAKPAAVILNPDSIPDGGKLHIRLMKDSSSIDETAFTFEHTGTIKFNFNNDARYFPGFGVASLSSVTGDGVSCAIQTIPFKANYAIPLNVNARKDDIYILKISLFQNIPAGTHVWLKDRMRNDSLDLRVGNYSFNLIKADTASYGSNRFSLVLN